MHGGTEAYARPAEEEEEEQEEAGEEEHYRDVKKGW